MLSASSSSFRCSPGCIGVCAIAFFLLVIVYDLNIYRASGPCRPFKADPPLIVDTDAVLALAVAFQGFKAVAGQSREISNNRGRFQSVRLQACGPFDAGKGLDPFASSEIGG